MNYFEKIEAYKNGTLNEVERLVFEETLASDLALQQELAAYELGQDLFEFVGTTLSEETITAPEATDAADLLINFTANNLSETQILASDSAATNTAIIKPLKNREPNRSAWLVAASMLLILSLIGSQFYTASSPVDSYETPIAEQEQIEPTITKPVSPIVLPENNVPQQEIVAKDTPVLKVEKKAVAIKKKRAKVQDLALNSPQKRIETLPNRPEMPILAPLPLVVNITAQEITTGKVIATGESVVYNGGNFVTLKAGFHAKAGANFVATAANNTIFLANEVIEDRQPVVYKTSKIITLKPGFHAKKGIDFIAKANSGLAKELSTNVIISSNEAIVYKAGSTITLTPGFHAKAGAGFVATIEGE